LNAEIPHRVLDLSIDNVHRSTYGHQIDALAMFDWLVDERVVPYRAIRSHPTPPR
jgi:hypothetical protein